MPKGKGYGWPSKKEYFKASGTKTKKSKKRK